MNEMANWRERITAAIERITAGHSPMRIPADMTDPDIVLSDCLAHLDAEPARLAAAREEQREACATECNGDYSCATAGLTSTPLADRIAELEADQHCPTCGSSVYTCVDCDVAPLRAERDALRAQVEAARAEAAKWPGQCGKFVLRAMDEATP